MCDRNQDIFSFDVERWKICEILSIQMIKAYFDDPKHRQIGTDYYTYIISDIFVRASNTSVRIEYHIKYESFLTSLVNMMRMLPFFVYITITSHGAPNVIITIIISSI